MKPVRCRDDRGSAAIELPLAVGLLLLPMAMIVMALPSWPERQTVATAAAKEAASLYANAPDPTSGVYLAQAAVDQAAANYGLPANTLTLQLIGEWCRSCPVTASVRVDIPALAVPLIGDIGAFQWTATSTARIDDYRSISPGGQP